MSMNESEILLVNLITSLCSSVNYIKALDGEFEYDDEVKTARVIG
jgi:hypothetical protein